MIYLEMAGRLGNQLFRYSFAKKVSILCDEDLIIDFKRVYDKGEKNYGWDNSLKLFNTSDYIEDNNSKKKYFFKNATIFQLVLYFMFKFISKLLSKNKKNLKKFQLFVQPIMNRNNLYFLELGYYDYDFKYLKKNKVKYICGCFECSKYFDDIGDIIKKEITPKSETKKNIELLNLINSTESICISVRRGDFVTNEKNSKLYNICTKEYFESAIKKISELRNNPCFFIFSDDVEWVKENINFFDFPVYSETGTDTLEEKLRLMSSCKHFIISNSTFSWWAQYLSKNEEKIVISPDRWYANNLSSDLLEDGWIKLKTKR